MAGLRALLVATALLPAATPALAQTGDPATCTEPGITLLTDPADSPPPGTDMRSFQLSQPPQPGSGDRTEDQLLVFRINISPGAQPNTNTAWFISFNSPAGVRGVRMTGDAAGRPVFESYIPGANSAGGRDGRFVAASRPAEPSSTFNAAAGQIRIVVKVTELGLLGPGRALEGFNGGVTVNGVAGASMLDSMPNNLSRSGSYTLHDNTVCGGAPLKPAPALPLGSGLPPRFQIHVAPEALGNDAGEPSIGHNKFTGRTMFISYTQALRQTYQENRVPQVLPASCEADWEDKSGTLTTVNTLDPILFTDEATGRTFNSQLAGNNSLMEFTDDDGETWSPAQAGPPSGGADHQTLASGPYPPGRVPPNATWPASGPKRAVYYCAQSVGAATCSRSDDGGTTFGPGFAFKNSECAAGALHGHVKVAPDGTVYVPDSSQCIQALGYSADRIVAFVSEDAGQTWQARPIPQSEGGDASDPSVGIASDGTAYMCYTNADASIRVAVSKDKGRTWTGGWDIGAPVGVVQARFPQMIAGDPDRAACAFLGTSTPGNGYALNFRGAWHGYIATTYDGGESWHLVNVTPDDPVQGYGGIGTSGVNRNLLDFNDLQVDDRGRLLFAFADGCTGACVRDPSANAFEAKATIVRQTGGRTMYSAFDDVATVSPFPRFNALKPILPEAACARQDRSRRTFTHSEVVWNPPDSGGSPVTQYLVYRSENPAGPFDLVGTSGPETRYVDRSTNHLVEKYYYRIRAVNAVGNGPVSNTIELVIDPSAENTCAVPGLIVAADAEGDVAAEDMDIVFVGVAEPKDMPDEFVITLKLAGFSAGTPPSGSFYPILFSQIQGSTYISLDSTAGPPRFTRGTYAAGPQGLLTFTEQGALDPRSAYAPDGTITFVVPRSFFGSPPPGAVIAGFDARSRAGAQSATSRDTAGPASYTVRGTAVCDDPGAVLAELSASRAGGRAPLDVGFTLSGLQTAGKALDSYTLVFGDEDGGQSSLSGKFGAAPSAQALHTYRRPGVYRARLWVTDASGQSSTNLAEQTITVLADLPPVADTGPPLRAVEGTRVTLDGTRSSDPEGRVLKFAWSQLAGSPVKLDVADAPTASFEAPQVPADAVLVFRLVVTDPEGGQGEDDVVVTVVDQPAPPVTVAEDRGNNHVFGGAPAWGTLLLFLALAGWNRRRRLVP